MKLGCDEIYPTNSNRIIYLWNAYIGDIDMISKVKGGVLYTLPIITQQICMNWRPIVCTSYISHDDLDIFRIFRIIDKIYRA